MAITIGDAVLYLTSDDKQLDSGLAGAESKTTSWVGRVGGLLATGLTAGFVAIGAAIVGFGAAAFAAGMTVDASLDSIRAKTGATGGELAGLEESFRNVFANVPVDATQVSDAIGILNAKLGLSGPTLEQVTTGLLDARRIMDDTALSAEQVAGAFSVWSITGEDAAVALDEVFVASQQTGVPMSTLLAQAQQFAPQFQAMGFSFRESTALLGSLGAAGLDVTTVMGGMRLASTKFVKAGKPLNESLMATFDAITNATSAADALTIGVDTFGGRAGPALVEAIRSGQFSLEDLTAAMGEADGAIGDTAAATEDWGEKFDRLKNKATLALEPLGTKLMEIAGNFLDQITPAVETGLAAFSDFFQGIMTGEDPIGDLANLVYALAGVLGLDADSLFNTVLSLRGPFDILTSAISSFMSYLKTGDISDFYAVLYDTFGEGTAVFVADLFDAISNGAQIAGTWLRDVLVPALITLGGQAQTWIQGTLVPAFLTLSAWFNENREPIMGALAGIAAALTLIFVDGAITAAIAGAVPIFAGIATAIAAINLPLVLLVAGAALLGAAWAGNWGGIRDITMQVWTETLQPALAQLVAWLQVNLPIAIQALANFWTTVLQPALAAMAAWVGVNLPIAIQALADFWTNVLQPALAAIWTFITTSLVPAIIDIATWIGINLPPLIQALADFWTNTLAPALAAIWSFITTSLIPAIVDIATWVGTNLPPLIQNLADFWNNTLLPAITAIWNFITVYLVPLFTALATLLIAVVGAAVEVLTGIWETRLLPIITAVHDFINTYLMPIFTAIGTFITGTLLIALANLVTNFNTLKDALDGPVGTALTWFKDSILTPMGTTMENIKRFIIGIINKLTALSDLINNIDWGVLHPGSPTPLEIGLRGAAKAADLLVGNLGLLDRVRDKLFEKKGWEFRGQGNRAGVRRYIGLRPPDPLIGPDPSIDPFDPLPVGRLPPIGPPGMPPGATPKVGDLGSVLARLAAVLERPVKVIVQLESGGAAQSYDAVRVLYAQDAGAY